MALTFNEFKSTITAILSLVHDCHLALDSGRELCYVFIDLCKAFDNAPHLPWLHKLISLHVDPFIVKWISDYLANQTQAVVLGGCQSGVLPVVSSNPQGFVLGPLLFLVYINEVTNTISFSKLSMYADDIAITKLSPAPLITHSSRRISYLFALGLQIIIWL